MADKHHKIMPQNIKQKVIAWSCHMLKRKTALLFHHIGLLSLYLSDSVYDAINYIGFFWGGGG